MAVISLFWDTNMAAVTSCENTLYSASSYSSQISTNALLTIVAAVIIATTFLDHFTVAAPKEQL